MEIVAKNKIRVEEVVGSNDLPWWDGSPKTPSTKYFVCVFDPEELGQPNPFGREKNLFRFVRMEGDKEIVISSGIVEQEKICSGSGRVQRQIWVREKRLGDCFFYTPPEVEKSVPQSIIESGFKNVIDQIVTSRASTDTHLRSLENKLVGEGSLKAITKQNKP